MKRMENNGSLNKNQANNSQRTTTVCYRGGRKTIETVYSDFNKYSCPVGDLNQKSQVWNVFMYIILFQASL